MAETERLYVVMNRYLNGEWGVADFWDLPFASTHLRRAQKMRRQIEAQQALNRWKYKKSRIARIDVPVR